MPFKGNVAPEEAHTVCFLSPSTGLGIIFTNKLLHIFIEIWVTNMVNIFNSKMITVITMITFIVRHNIMFNLHYSTVFPLRC